MYPAFRLVAGKGLHVASSAAGVRSVVAVALSAVATLLDLDVDPWGGARCPVDAPDVCPTFAFALAPFGGPATLIVDAEASLEAPGEYAAYVDRMCLGLRTLRERSRSGDRPHTGMLMDGDGCVVFAIDTAGTSVTCSRCLHAFSGDMPGSDVAPWILCALEGALLGCSGWSANEWTSRHDACVGRASRDQIRASRMAEMYSLMHR